MTPMRFHHPALVAVLLFSGGDFTMAQQTSSPARSTPSQATPQHHPYLGMWITKDGYIRHELLPNGRYIEERGGRKNAYQGRYWVKGNRIDYIDDTGFSADGEFRDGVFHHAGYVLHHEDKR
jgi:hypothetical protein